MLDCTNTFVSITDCRFENIQNSLITYDDSSRGSFEIKRTIFYNCHSSFSFMSFLVRQQSIISTCPHLSFGGLEENEGVRFISCGSTSYGHISITVELDRFMLNLTEILSFHNVEFLEESAATIDVSFTLRSNLQGDGDLSIIVFSGLPDTVYGKYIYLFRRHLIHP